MATGINITATSTFPKGVLSPKRVRAYILNAGLKTGAEMKKMLDDIVEPWRHTVGRTKPKITYAGGDALVSITIYDDVFWYLNNGTDVRWAAMDKMNFIPKTKVGVLKSGPGSPGFEDPVVRGPSAKMPHHLPGIIARNWVVLIEGRTEIDLKRRIDAAIQQSFKLGP